MTGTVRLVMFSISWRAFALRAPAYATVFDTLTQDFQQFAQETGGEHRAINSLAQENAAHWNDFYRHQGWQYNPDH